MKTITLIAMHNEIEMDIKTFREIVAMKNPKDDSPTRIRTWVPAFLYEKSTSTECFIPNDSTSFIVIQFEWGREPQQSEDIPEGRILDRCTMGLKLNIPCQRSIKSLLNEALVNSYNHQSHKKF